MVRKTKWYRKNEKEVMENLGLRATPGSGCGWIAKEDGENDSIICQLKSTDNNSIKINKIDLDKLESNAIVEHKIPIFAIQFINKELYVLLKPIDIPIVNEYLKTGKVEKNDIVIKDSKQKEVKKIKVNNKLGKKFRQEKEKQYQKNKPTIYDFTL